MDVGSKEMRIGQEMFELLEVFCEPEDTPTPLQPLGARQVSRSVGRVSTGVQAQRTFREARATRAVAWLGMESPRAEVGRAVRSSQGLLRARRTLESPRGLTRWTAWTSEAGWPCSDNAFAPVRRPRDWLER